MHSGREVAFIAVCCWLVFMCGVIAVVALGNHESYWFLSPFPVCAILLLWLLHRQHIRDQQRPWDRVTFLEFQNGKIALVPSRKMRGLGYTAAEVPFPPGSTLEYRVETGDMYFTGDHGIALRWTLWVVDPRGKRWQLREFADEFRVQVAAAYLRNAGIPFRIIKAYDGQEGEHTETDITVERIQASTKAWKRNLAAILMGTSSLWLGAITGALVQNWEYVVAIGVTGYTVIAILTVLSKTSKRTVLIQIISSIFTYAAGYAVVFFTTRHIFHR